MINASDHRHQVSSIKPPTNSPNQDLAPVVNQPLEEQPESDWVDSGDYRMEAARLASYRNWPLPFMDPAKLAAAGFYFTGDADKVKCFECQVEICQWVEGDNPMADHQRWSGRCRFIRKIPCGNVPIGTDPATIPSPRPRSRDVCGPYGVGAVPPDAEEDCHSSLLPSSARLGSLGLSRTKEPAHPEYMSREARYRTFESWPKSIPQTKDQLADAGFYYTGKGDQTLCYHCGGGLRDWEQNDDPWEQHAKWFSKCCYLLMVKGQEYVNSVTGQQVEPLTREETHLMELPSFIRKVPASSESLSMETEQSNASDSGFSSSGSQSSEASQESQSEATTNLLNTGSTGSGNKNKSEDDGRICKICYNGELGVVFLPCGHMVACVNCAPGMANCAVCREPVTMTVRAFLS